MATSVSEEDERYCDRRHAQNLLDGLACLRADSQFCDIELCVGKSKYQAHRAVLSACSPYFQGMFASGMREAHQDSVDILGIDPHVLQLLLDFMYTGYVQVEADTVQDLLSAADMLQLQGVVTICCSFLKTQLHPSNCLGILRFARSHACDDLAATCLAYACAYFAQVSKMEEFLDVDVDDIMSLLKSEELRVDNEFEVFQAAMSWILHSPSDRRKTLVRVLEPVRFPIISQHQLFEYIRECPDLSLRVAMGKLLERFNPDKTQSSSVRPAAAFSNPSLSRPRQNARKHLVLIGGYRRNPGERFDDMETLDSVVQLDTFTQRWATMPSLQQPRHGHDAAFLNGSLYAMGGECDALINNNVETLDPVSKQWSDMPSLLSPRCGHGVCTVNGVMYVLGGIEGSDVLKSIEKFDEERGAWCLAGNMTEGRSYFATAEVDGLIYVAGGCNDPTSGELKSLESYNPITNEWNSLASMKHKRAHFKMGVLGDHLYVVGGANKERNVLSSVERYSVIEEKWTSLKHMSTARADMSVATVNGLIYVMGGRSSGKSTRAPKTLDLVECYDPRSNSWITMGKMPTSRCEAAVTVI
ncbi:actin-binding protein IPP-like [Patiria miniata]|uniref:BTB domain-containing protein n=1 Tax=Patiria miniata TaxID=46514 RepID=A0A913ZYN8_PATMI|nr:actin-binding protein IPP-like [Patiria miniata]